MAQTIYPHEKFAQYVNTKPNQIFLNQPFLGEWHTYTWREADRQIRCVAAYLQSLGLERGSKVAILSKNCAHWIMSDLAIMMAGYVSVPLYPTITADTIEYVMKHSDAKVAFIGKLDSWQKQKAGLPSGVHTISYPFWTEKCDSNWENIINSTPPLRISEIRNGDELITIIYTSGTTGLPKGVMHSFHSISFAAANALEYLNKINEEENFFSYLPMSHIAERMLVEMGAIYSGGKISFAESLDSFPANLKKVQPSVFLAVPRIWTKFQMGILSKVPQDKLSIILSIPIVSSLFKKKIKEGLGLGRAKYVLSGAAPLPPAMMNWFDKLDIKICEAYAMTENSAYSHFTKAEFRKPGKVGQPFPHVDVRISEEGEIQVKSEANMVGYYKDPEKTKETISQDGYICTGDQGEVDHDGFLKITGRIKDIFKTDKGKYVAPAPIEMNLSKNTFIEQVCLVGSNLPQTMAMIVLSEEAKQTDKKVVEESIVNTVMQLNPSLDKHERIKKVVIMEEEWTIDNNLLTPTLKVKRNVLEKKFEHKYQEWYQLDGNVLWGQ
ncbi:MAG: AMP-binding protein [Chitinophagales bacterium]|nr:AMP-binding protein [Chitinophagales bacterium]MCZ2394158.1 AMP-binding protein [Chitinophagales bacterium]